MGSYSYLRIGKLNIDSSKNFLLDHSSLFTFFDKKNVVHYYADDSTELKPGYSKKLINCRVTLDLLGHSFKKVESRINEQSLEMEISFPFNDLISLISKINIHKSIWDEIEDFPHTTEFSTKIIQIIKLDEKYKHMRDSLYDIGVFLDTIHPYDILSIFIHTNLHLDEDVIWELYDLIEGGWVTEKEIQECFEVKNRFLLITEGSSDTNILKKAFSYLKPEITDFFDFIDMEKNYPFTGVGSLVNFYHGLLKIGTSKKIIFIFDNDTAGNEAIGRCVCNDKIPIKTMKLPIHQEFMNFTTIGPSGISQENINDRAVSIELFLDLTYKNSETPIIRWVSYSNRLKKYQGSLESKDNYTKTFFKAINDSETDYDFSKMDYLLDSIIQEAQKF